MTGTVNTESHIRRNVSLAMIGLVKIFRHTLRASEPSRGNQILGAILLTLRSRLGTQSSQHVSITSIKLGCRYGGDTSRITHCCCTTTSKAHLLYTTLVCTLDSVKIFDDENESTASYLLSLLCRDTR